MDGMNKKQMTEEDIKLKFITPAITQKWSLSRISMETKITDGKINLRGNLVARSRPKKADYVLYCSPNNPIVIVEAKDNNHSVSHGLQQAMTYAMMMDIPFAYSSNGDAFYEHDFLTGAERQLALEDFPSPDDLYARLKVGANGGEGMNPQEEAIMAQPYFSSQETFPPRYYQQNAINRTLDAIARGQQRILLVMATGTGKTYTAFQIVYRLLQSGMKRKILYLADRNILVDQSIQQDFAPLEKVIHKINVGKDSKADITSHEVYFSLYQQLVGDDDQEHYTKGLMHMNHETSQTDDKMPMDSAPHQISDAPIRTAAYCRVSTRLEEQEGSYEIQMDYFREKINSNPKMVLVGLYGDNGKSGLKLKGRIGLQRLMADCKAGKIDLILTKSVSRFARSMADCVELIQQLRSLKVTVFFEKESLRSTDVKCDLVLNILAAMVQEESHSISQNTIRSHEQYASEGRPYGQVTYGYQLEGTTTWRVNPQEAKRVQCAFSMAAEGRNYQAIRHTLDRMEAEDQTGMVWAQRRLKRLLSNPMYLGDYYSHGTVCLTPGHHVVNKGYRDRYYIEEHHEPLVTKKVFERVQMMLKSRALVSYAPMTPGREAIQRNDR